ncbi:hypothetical protein ACFW04_002214 [Cataglyphis niger]
MATDPIELLLEAEIFPLVFKDGLRKGGQLAPIAQNTILGWVLSGGCGVATLQGHLRSLQCTAEHDLSTMVRRFWKQEEIPSALIVLAPEEKRCKKFFVQTHNRTTHGQYVFRLSFTATLRNLGKIRKPAEKLLTAMERKSSRDSRFGDFYRTFMQEDENLKHMNEINEGSTTNHDNAGICYLTHHEMLRESSTTNFA